MKYLKNETNQNLKIQITTQHLFTQYLPISYLYRSIYDLLLIKWVSTKGKQNINSVEIHPKQSHN